MSISPLRTVTGCHSTLNDDHHFVCAVDLSRHHIVNMSAELFALIIAPGADLEEFLILGVKGKTLPEISGEDVTRKEESVFHNLPDIFLVTVAIAVRRLDCHWTVGDVTECSLVHCGPRCLC
jgi:hypothetical protein